MIDFNKPYLTGKEGHYIYQAVLSGKISGDGMFTKRCHSFFEQRFGFHKCLLTTSCTDALEMAALLINIKEGDEVIMPSFTFVSTSNAFALRGAKIIFCDSDDKNPNIDADKIEELITDRTKAVVVVHYAGIACDMDSIMDTCKKHNLYLIEDAAQAIDSYYTGRDGIKKPLGSLGHMSAFSFHETKNIMSGEGGMLVINDGQFATRAEIIREKGTNRAQFFKGEVDKYGWVDVGSSFLPSDIIAAFLFAQLENLDDIQQKRVSLWQQYYNNLLPLQEAGKLTLPHVPGYATNNAHMFYIVCNSYNDRTEIIKLLKSHSVHSVFHYLSLHKSGYYTTRYPNDNSHLPESDRYTDCLLRLPMYYELTLENVNTVTDLIKSYFK